MDESKSYKYFDLKRNERDTVIGYLLNTLLQARRVCRIPSNDKAFDEDVNIYLAHLLLAFSLPDYQALTRRYLNLNASDLMELVDQSQDKVMRYFIYKVNADYLLVHLGIFHDLASAPADFFRKSERQFVEMGQSYYEQASEYNHQIYRKHTAVGEVLEKLSHHFGDYKKILEVMRSEFFHMMKKISSVESCPPRESFEDLGKLLSCVELEYKQNEFLDLYSEWLKTRSVDLAGKLRRLAEEIKSLNPSFGFDSVSLIPAADFQSGGLDLNKEDPK
jgi:hypothetical protein